MHYPKNSWAILPAAQCLFGKTKIELADIPTQWKDGTVVICKKPNGKLHFIAGASGTYSELNKLKDCHHDQTMASFGAFLVINEIAFKTVDGIVEWSPKIPFDKNLNVCTKATMAVFK